MWHAVHCSGFPSSLQDDQEEGTCTLNAFSAGESAVRCEPYARGSQRRVGPSVFLMAGMLGLTPYHHQPDSFSQPKGRGVWI